MPETIGNWTTTLLTKFIQDALRNNPPQFTVNQTIEKLVVTDQITVKDQIQFMRAKTTVGAAGGASALPATPKGYIEVLDPSGNVMLIPYFNNA